MTETRWTQVGTFRTDVEADEVSRVLDEAMIPYSRAGVLVGAIGAHAGTIEIHVPNDFVDAAKAAFARALSDRRSVVGPPIDAEESDPGEKAAFESRLLRDRNRQRNHARAAIALLALAFVGAGIFSMVKRGVSLPPVIASSVVGLALVAALVVSFRRRG